MDPGDLRSRSPGPNLWRMPSPRLRPTFDMTHPAPPDQVMSRIRARIDLEKGSRRCMSRGTCAELFPEEDDRHIWSPYLSVQAEPADEGGTRLHARFAPYPEVWTFFMFVYGIAWFFVLFGGTFGYVQWASNEPAWGLWGVWLGLPTVIGLHVASAVGQRLGEAQMRELKERLETLVPEAEEVAGEEPASHGDTALDAAPG